MNYDDMYNRIPVPSKYAESIGEREYEIKAVNHHCVGKIGIDQIHFIKQKVRRYRGPCKCLCCCLEDGQDTDEETLI